MNSKDNIMRNITFMITILYIEWFYEIQLLEFIVLHICNKIALLPIGFF